MVDDNSRKRFKQDWNLDQQGDGGGGVGGGGVKSLSCQTQLLLC